MTVNSFDRFTVSFTGDKVFLDRTAFPLGQLTTDVLNMDSEVLTEIDRRVNDFMTAVRILFQEKTDSVKPLLRGAGSAVCFFLKQYPHSGHKVIDAPVNFR